MLHFHFTDLKLNMLGHINSQLEAHNNMTINKNKDTYFQQLYFNKSLCMTVPWFKTLFNTFKKDCEKPTLTDSGDYRSLNFSSPQLAGVNGKGLLRKLDFSEIFDDSPDLDEQLTLCPLTEQDRFPDIQISRKSQKICTIPSRVRPLIDYNAIINFPEYNDTEPYNTLSGNLLLPSSNASLSKEEQCDKLLDSLDCHLATNVRGGTGRQYSGGILACPGFEVDKKTKEITLGAEYWYSGTIGYFGPIKNMDYYRRIISAKFCELVKLVCEVLEKNSSTDQQLSISDRSMDKTIKKINKHYINFVQWLDTFEENEGKNIQKLELFGNNTIPLGLNNDRKKCNTDFLWSTPKYFQTTLGAAPPKNYIKKNYDNVLALDLNREGKNFHFGHSFHSDFNANMLTALKMVNQEDYDCSYFSALGPHLFYLRGLAKSLVKWNLDIYQKLKNESSSRNRSRKSSYTSVISDNGDGDNESNNEILCSSDVETSSINNGGLVLNLTDLKQEINLDIDNAEKRWPRVFKRLNEIEGMVEEEFKRVKRT